MLRDFPAHVLLARSVIHVHVLALHAAGVFLAVLRARFAAVARGVYFAYLAFHALYVFRGALRVHAPYGVLALHHAYVHVIILANYAYVHVIILFLRANFALYLIRDFVVKHAPRAARAVLVLLAVAASAALGFGAALLGLYAARRVALCAGCGKVGKEGCFASCFRAVGTVFAEGW